MERSCRLCSTGRLAEHRTALTYPRPQARMGPAGPTAIRSANCAAPPPPAPTPKSPPVGGCHPCRRAKASRGAGIAPRVVTQVCVRCCRARASLAPHVAALSGHSLDDPRHDGCALLPIDQRFFWAAISTISRERGREKMRIAKGLSLPQSCFSA